MDIDQVHLNLNQNSINILKLIIALLMFGVALELKFDDFKSLFKQPRALIGGLLTHYLLFPALTLIFIFIADFRPSISLGLVMIAACPGGNLSNLMTSISKGNIALSVGLTSLTTLISIVSTPFMILSLGQMVPGAASLLGEIQVDSKEVLEGVFVILGFPLILGMLCSRFFPIIGKKIQKVMSKLSIVFLLIFILGALGANYQHFLEYFHMIIGVCLIHNFIALGSGFLMAKVIRLNKYDTKGLTIPMGIRNTALGLALVFQFFQGLGGMAMIVAWWGISQITVGLIVSNLWGKNAVKEVVA